MSALSVFFHRSHDDNGAAIAGLPVLSGQAGALITLLDALLVNGYNLKTVTGITRSGSTATLSFGSAHGFVTKEPILIVGADQTEYNGSFIVETVPTTTSLTVTVSGTPATPATGASLSAKAAPIGWTKAFTGTNKGVYKSSDMASSQIPLRIDDSNAQYAAVTGYISMSDVDTGVESWFAGYWKKSSTSDATARPWLAVADSKTLHLFVGWNQTVGAIPQYAHYVFGDIGTYVVGDVYQAMLCAHSNNNPAALGTDVGVIAACNVGSTQSNSTGMKCARSYSALVNSARYLRAMSAAGGASVGNNCSGNDSAMISGTQPADNGLHFVPVYLLEHDSAASRFPIRGESRGHYHVIEQLPAVGVNGYTALTGVTNLANRIVLLIRGAASSTDCREAIDATGPWA